MKKKSGRCSLLELAQSSAGLMRQIQFLGRLVGTDPGALPTGVELLSYLFERTLNINAADIYFVMVSVLKLAAEPYFR